MKKILKEAKEKRHIWEHYTKRKTRRHKQYL